MVGQATERIELATAVVPTYPRYPLVMAQQAATANAAAGARIDKAMAIYGKFDSYRGMLDREGAAGPADVAMIGDETALRKQIQRFRDIGVTDLNCAILGVGDRDTTVQFLAGELS